MLIYEDGWFLDRVMQILYDIHAGGSSCRRAMCVACFLGFAARVWRWWGHTCAYRACRRMQIGPPRPTLRLTLDLPEAFDLESISYLVAPPCCSNSKFRKAESFFRNWLHRSGFG